MNKSVCVRGLAIGTGMPKICVPVMGKTQDEVLKNAREIVGSGADFVEWRADYFEAVGDLQQTEEMAAMLRDIFKELPLLFTFRTAREGGEREISLEEYERLLFHMADSGTVDIIDVEVFRGYDCLEAEFSEEDCQKDGFFTAYGKSLLTAGYSVTDGENERVAELIRSLSKKLVVIGSYHDFKKTPGREEMLARLLFMDRLGVTIPKLAVMPESREDVLLLMETTSLADRLLPDKPLITMSMGEKGIISRIVGGQFGSAVTFGCVGKASAPGQMEAPELKNILAAVYARS